MKNLNELFFWSHLAFIPFAVSTGIFLPPTAVIFLVITHRVHTFVFDGCAFSAIQKTSGGIPKNMDFLQFASKKLLGIRLTVTQSKIVDYSLVSITLLFVVLRVLV